MLNGLLYSYFGIAFFLILTGCGLPIPEEAAIITAGAFAASGRLEPIPALLACLFGAIAGDSVMYCIGRNFGYTLLHKHQFWIRFITPQREQQIERLLKKHGVKMLLLTRFLVGLRSPVYFTAGVLRVPYPRFLLVDTLCALLVVTPFFGLIYFCGPWIWEWIKSAEWAITVAVVAAVAIAGIAYRLHRRSRAMLNDDPAEEPQA